MELKWPTYEEFVAGNLKTRALSDARGPEAVEEDAWQTNVMVRVTSDEGQHLDLEPMLLDLEPEEPRPGRSVSFNLPPGSKPS